MRVYLMLLLAALSLVTQSPDARSARGAQAANVGRVTGVVRDDRNEPLARVLVKLTSENTGEVRSALTDREGRFEIEAEAGRQKVEVFARGFRPLALSLLVREGRVNVASFNFTPADRILPGQSNKCRVEGTVTDAATGDPIPGAKVVVTQLGTRGNPKLDDVTDADGWYSIPNVNPGRTRVEVFTEKDAGYRSPESRRIQLEEGEVRPLDIGLRKKRK